MKENKIKNKVYITGILILFLILCVLFSSPKAISYAEEYKEIVVEEGVVSEISSNDVLQDSLVMNSNGDRERDIERRRYSKAYTNLFGVFGIKRKPLWRGYGGFYMPACLTNAVKRSII